MIITIELECHICRMTTEGGGRLGSDTIYKCKCIPTEPGVGAGPTGEWLKAPIVLLQTLGPTSESVFKEPSDLLGQYSTMSSLIYDGA